MQLKLPTIPWSLISVISILPCVPIYISSIKFSKKEVARESNANESPALLVSVKKDSHWLANVESSPGIKIARVGKLRGSSMISIRSLILTFQSQIRG